MTDVTQITDPFPASFANARRITVTLRVWVLSGLWLLTMTGCASWRHWMAFSPRATAEPCVLAADASSEEIIDALNNNITKLYAWRSTDVKITAKQGGVPMSFSASLAVESPRKLRLIVNSIAGSEVDLGSNPERFWFWMRRGEPHGVMTASYDDLSDGRPIGPLPFQPEWLIAALGVVPWTSSDFTMHEQPAAPRSGNDVRHVAFVSEQSTPQGRAVKRTMIVDACHGTIREHSLHDSTGRLVAQVTLSHYQRDPSGVRLPHRVELTWPETGVELSLKIGHIEVNPASVSEQTWSMPSYPDSPVIDLTKFRP